MASNRATRYRLYRMLMRMQAKFFDELFVFAVAVRKENRQTPEEIQELAWRLTLERVHTFCSKKGSYAALFPDEGIIPVHQTHGSQDAPSPQCRRNVRRGA